MVSGDRNGMRAAMALASLAMASVLASGGQACSGPGDDRALVTPAIVAPFGVIEDEPPLPVGCAPGDPDACRGETCCPDGSCSSDPLCGGECVSACGGGDASYCCPAEADTCCLGFACSADPFCADCATDCGDGTCCPDATFCCSDGCSTDPSCPPCEVDCGDGSCCPSGTTCCPEGCSTEPSCPDCSVDCGDGSCCPESAPYCCADGSCDSVEC